MKKLFIFVLMLSLATFFAGCSNDKDDDVAKLEQQVQDAETTDYLAEEGTETETGQPATETVAAEEYAAIPDTAPPVEEKPIQMATGSPSETGDYTIQIASGKTWEYVNEMKDKFIERGYDAYIAEADFNGEIIYRVRIGGFVGYSDAVAVGEELKNKYSVNYWIDVK